MKLIKQSICKMKFFRNNWYWIVGIVIGLGIGSIITLHRVQSQTPAPEQETTAVAEQTPNVTQPQISLTPIFVCGMCRRVCV